MHRLLAAKFGVRYVLQDRSLSGASMTFGRTIATKGLPPLQRIDVIKSAEMRSIIELKDTSKLSSN
jgi:hypothetical protein